MADPVKVAVMQALAAMLGTVVGINSVILEEEFPFDLADIPEAQRPALYLWAELDEPQGGNRVARNDLEVMMALFLPLPAGGFPEFAITAETTWGRIKNKLADTAVLQTLRTAGVIKTELGASRKAKASEEWGEMTIPCRIDYGHAVKDAFTTTII